MKDLVEQMLAAYIGNSNWPGGWSEQMRKGMTAAAQVCLDAALGDATRNEWLSLPGHLSCEPLLNAFIASRRTLLALKTPEERVTVGMDHNGWFVERDGVVLQDKLKEGIAKAARRGLIAEMKEREG